MVAYFCCCFDSGFLDDILVETGSNFKALSQNRISGFVFITFLVLASLVWSNTCSSLERSDVPLVTLDAVNKNYPLSS